MKFDYQIRTAEELYNQLIEKGLEMDLSKEKIVHFLAHHSYFQFMLYFKSYWNGNHEFLNGTKFSIIRDTYVFDQKLRLNLLYYISEIENSFKNTFCQVMCQNECNIWRTEKSNFKDTRVFDDILSPIIQTIKDNNPKSDFIKKYMIKYTDPIYPPFRNMLEILSFGQISLMYKSVDDGYKKTIASYYKIDNSLLENWLQCLVTIRNICCHHNKLYDRQDLFAIRIPKIYKGMGIFEGHEKNLFGILAIMYYLLVQLNLDKKFLSDLKILLAEYRYINNIVREDWEEKLLLVK